MKRESILRKQCEHEGCKVSVSYSFSSHRMMVSSSEYKSKYYCMRHTNMSEILSGVITTTEVVLIANQLNGIKGLFWNGESGFISGPGFKAWADDFPAGTSLVVTARILPPVD